MYRTMVVAKMPGGQVVLVQYQVDSLSRAGQRVVYRCLVAYLVRLGAVTYYSQCCTSVQLWWLPQRERLLANVRCS